MEFKGKKLDDEKVRIINDITVYGRNIFITGNAGTGKSFLVEYLTENHREGLIVTATTGVAALNVKGYTLAKMSNRYNSVIKPDELVKEFFRKPWLQQKRRKIQECQTLIIDEVSMLKRDDFEYFDKVWRGVRECPDLPFGGVQVIMVGDFLQLPPVVKNRKLAESDYCFSSPVWDELNMNKHCLTTVYRTDDPNFTRILNDIRTGEIRQRGHESDLETLAGRMVQSEDDIPEHFRELIVRIFSSNAERDVRNHEELDKIRGHQIVFETRIRPGKERDAEKMIKDLPSEDPLTLKVGARVMLLCNDYFDKNLANGSTGTVASMELDGVWVSFDNGENVFVEYREYCLVEPAGKGKKSRDKVIFERIPLTLSWAITAHKSQGLSIPYLFCGFKGFFAPGQAYVAFSRATKLDQLWFTGFRPTVIMTCPHALKFHQKLHEELENENYS